MPDLSTLHPRFYPYARAFYDWARAVTSGGLIVTSARRTYAEQARLYEAHLRGQNNGLPASPPGSSDHELGLAFDMARMNRDPRQDVELYELGRYWTSFGGRWWPVDPVHFAAPAAWVKSARAGRF